MDYHSMKRKELQALCKKHNIPANSANSVLAEKLDQLLNEKKKPIAQQRKCLKSPVETTDECEDKVPRRQAKKVTFNPTNQVLEYELRSGKKQIMATETRARRKSVAKKADESVVNNANNTVDMVDGVVQAPVKLTRSKVQLLEKDSFVENNGKKKGRKAVKDVENGTGLVKEVEGNHGRVTRLKLQTLDERGAVQVDDNKQRKRSRKDSEIVSESVEEPVVARVRVTRSKAEDINPEIQIKRGRTRLAKDVENVEVPNEIMDVPVRVTRASRHTIKEDVGNTFDKSQVEKKRTRRESKATDTSDNVNNIVVDEKHERPKRKSLRTKGTEAVDEVKDDKVEVINDGPAMEPSRRNTRSKTENKVEGQPTSKSLQQVGEPLEHAGKKTVSRRKSVMQPEKIEKILHFEEPVNRVVTRRKSMMLPEKNLHFEEPVNRVVTRRKSMLQPEKTEKILMFEEPVNRVVTRRKSMLQEAAVKEVDKPLVGKRKLVTETNVLMSPTVGTRKTVGRKQSKGKSVLNEATENEIEAVANVTKSPKSRKRSGDSVVDYQVIETENISSVDASSKRSTRSNSKNQGKEVTYSPQSSVAKKQTGSILKTRASNRAIITDGSSVKSAKLSGTKIIEPVNNVETPVSKSVSFDVGEKATETQRTPNVGGSHRRSSRSAVISDRKQPSQSKKQPGEDAELSLDKVTKFTHDPAVNTAPVRLTRSGIKQGGKSAISLTEKLSKTKLSDSGSTPVIKSVNFDLDDNVAETERTAKVSEEPVVDEQGTDERVADEPVADEQVVDEPVTDEPVADEQVTDEPVADEQVTDELVADEPVNDEQVVVEPVTDEPVTDEQVVVEQVTDEQVVDEQVVDEPVADEPVVIVGKTVVMNESVSNTDNEHVSNPHKGSSSPIHLASFEQLDDKFKSSEMGTPVGPLTEDIGEDQAEKESEPNVSTCKDSSLKNADNYDASINSEYDDEDERPSTEMQVLNEPVSDGTQIIGMDEHDGAEDVIDDEKELANEPEFQDDKHDDDDAEDVVDAETDLVKEPEFEGDTQIYGMDEHDGAEDVVDTEKELANEPEFEGDTQIFGMDEHDGAEDVVDHEKELVNEPEFEGDTQIFGMDEHDDAEDVVVDTEKELATDPEFNAVDGNENGTESMPLSGDNMPSDGKDLVSNEDEAENEAFDVFREHESDPKPLTFDDSDTALFGKDDDFNITRLFEPTLESTSSDDMIETPFGKSDNAVTGKDDAQDEVNIFPKELETGLGTSNANNVEIPVMGNDVNVDPVMDDQSDGQDKESEYERSTSKLTSFVDEEYVEGADSAPALNENIEPEPMSIEAQLTPAATTVDACEESIPNIDKDADAQILGDIYGVENAHATDTKSDSLSDMKVVKISEPDDDTSIKQITEETETKTENDDTVSTDIKEHTISAVDHDLDSGKLVEESSNCGVDQSEHVISTTEERKVSGQRMGDFGNESLSIAYAKEEYHVGDTPSDSPTFVSDGDRNKQDREFDQDADIVNENTTAKQLFSMPDSSLKALFTQPATTPSSHLKEDLSLKTLFTTPATTRISHLKDTQLEESSKAFSDIVKENETAKELFSLPDSSLKALFTQPATTSSSHLKEGKHDAISFEISDASHDEDIGTKGTQTPVSNLHEESESARCFNDNQISGLQSSARPSSFIQGNYNLEAYFVNSEKSEQHTTNVVDREFDHDVDFVKENTTAFPDSSLKALFTQQATTSSSHLNECKQDAISFDISDCSHDEDIGEKVTATPVSNLHAESESARCFNAVSMETLFKTPAITRITHTKDSQMETVSSEAFSGKTQVIETPATTRISHLKDSHQMETGSSVAYTGKTQVIETPGQDNVINRVDSNYENFYDKYFDDEEVDGSSDRPGELKVDQYDFSSEAAKTGHFEASGLKDNSIHGTMPEKKQD